MAIGSVLKAWTVGVLFFINLLNYMDRYTIAGILPELQNITRNGFKESINDTEGGLLQTVFIISFMLLSPVFGYLGDRFTRKYIMAVGIFIWSGFVLAGSFSVNYAMLMVTRSLVGVGEASYATIAPTLIADLFPTETRLRILMIFYMAIPIGSAFGYGVGSFVSSQIHLHFHYQQSWRWALRVSPGLGVIAVLLIIFTIREPPRGHSEDPRNKAGVKGKFGLKHYINDLVYLLKNKTFLLTSFGFAALTFSVGAMAQWAPTYVYRLSCLLHSEHPNIAAYTESQASLGFGIVTVIAGLFGTISGAELSKLISRKTDQADCIVCAISLLTGAPVLYFGLVFGGFNLYLGWVLVFVAEFFFCLMWAPIGAILLYVVIPERRSTAEAFQILIIHILGDATSPFIIGAISDALCRHLNHDYDLVYSHAIGMQYSLYITVIISVIGGGLFLMSTLTVVSDTKAVEAHVRRSNTRHHATESQNGSLSSDVPDAKGPVVIVEEDNSEDDEITENSHLVKTCVDVSINT